MAKANLPSPQDILPHRPPMLYVDSLTELTPDVSCQGVWQPPSVEYRGHFPGGRYVLPGIKTVEHLAQVASIAVLAERPGMVPLFTGIGETSFLAPVLKGHLITSDVRILDIDRRNRVIAEGDAYAERGRICDARLSFQLVDEERFSALISTEDPQ